MITFVGRRSAVLDAEGGTARLLCVHVSTVTNMAWFCAAARTVRDGQRGGRREGEFPADGDCPLYRRTGGISGLLPATDCVLLCVHASLCSCLLRRTLGVAARLTVCLSHAFNSKT